MEFESLIFDIDGTLWDSRSLVAEGYNIQLKSEGLDHLCTNAEELKPLFGKVLEEIGDILFASIPKPERYRLMERCMARENRYLEENECRIGFPGVAETLESVLDQYQTTVKPMHEKYVEPSKRFAHIVVPEGGKNIVALDMVMGRIQRHLENGEE